MPRAGGDGTQLPPELPFINQFEVVDDKRLFGKVSLDPEVDEIDIVDGTKTPHSRDASSLLRDGSDLYFAEAGVLKKATGADLDAATMLAAGPVETLLGIAGDWIYGVGGADAERAVRRFPKAGGAAEVLRTLGAKETASLGDNALLFTRQDGTRQYVCAAGLDGKNPIIYGFLETSGVSFLTADANFIYAVTGFNVVRFKR
jgi:hypothetical protein